MNVAIITYHYPANYGAVLQCLALHRALNQLGLDAEVLDYRPPSSMLNSFWRGWGIRKGLLFKNIPKRWIKLRYGPTMERAFNEFRSEFFTLSPRCATNNEVAALVDNYDAVVAGSDQIWHFAKESVYFMEWGKPYKGRRISYAPCCGHATQSADNDDRIRNWIMNVDHLSVRNRFSCELVHNLTDRSPEIVADPTLLVNLDDVSRKIDLPCSEYILMYTLGGEINGGHTKVITSIRRKVGNLPVVAVVPSAHKPNRAPWADHVVYTAGPREWLYLVANASFVYTDSFHGILFSIKYDRPFLSYYSEEGRAPRLIDLADRYCIKKCIIDCADEASNEEWNDWDAKITKKLIAEHIDFSMKFLEVSFQD